MISGVRASSIEDRVDFVDEREVELALHQIFDLPRHVVAQVIEADLVVRHVGDVAVVGRAALRRSRGRAG